MLKAIARLSPDLVDFINSLDHLLNQPQAQHIARVADGLITTEGRKTLSGLYRAITGNLCPEMTESIWRDCQVDPICAHYKDLFQPVIRTMFY